MPPNPALMRSTVAVQRIVTREKCAYFAALKELSPTMFRDERRVLAKLFTSGGGLAAFGCKGLAAFDVLVDNVSEEQIEQAIQVLDAYESSDDESSDDESSGDESSWEDTLRFAASGFHDSSSSDEGDVLTVENERARVMAHFDADASSSNFSVDDGDSDDGEHNATRFLADPNSSAGVQPSIHVISDSSDSSSDDGVDHLVGYDNSDADSGTSSD